MKTPNIEKDLDDIFTEDINPICKKMFIDNAIIMSYFINFENKTINVNYDIFKDIYEIDAIIIFKYECLLFSTCDYTVMLCVLVSKYNIERTQLIYLSDLKIKINDISIKYQYIILQYILENEIMGREIGDFPNLEIEDLVGGKFETNLITIFENSYNKFYLDFYEEIINEIGFNIDKYFIVVYFQKTFYGAFQYNKIKIYKEQSTEINYYIDNLVRVKTNIEIIFEKCYF
uniref:Uncharacterized protein n=1 Tax=Pithovirus LCDPAC02 TaxID=2506601 RepID=A0A481YNV2_9VIRU|nr:MAG: hypothetical protein LCDPAC02_01470 [Pithovirus LCDPAC02]